VLVAIGLALVVVAARSALVLVGVALFLAVGLEPAVSTLVRRGLRRAAAVTGVAVLLVVVVVGFVVSAVVPLAAQAGALVQQAPAFVQGLQDRSSLLGRLNEQFHVQERLGQVVADGGPSLIGGVLGAGSLVFGALANTVVVLILTIYFLGSLPSIRTLFYRFLPHSRRPRAILIGDQVFAKVGSYVLGNLLLSLIAGLATFVFLVIVNVPYALALAVLVALLDLVPVVGAPIGGIIVAIVALGVSLPVALATVAFYVVYHFVEGYLLMPKIIGKTVDVPDTVTVVAVLIGGVLLGIVGALVAIPVAAAVMLLLREAVFPRLDRA
jgi:predicted PurR-regulated permease PerM